MLSENVKNKICNFIILINVYMVLYLSLTRSEIHRIGLFQNRVLNDGKGGASNTHGTGEKSIKALNGKPKRVIPLGRPRRRRKENVT